jgi:hypothetical protein
LIDFASFGEKCMGVYELAIEIRERLAALEAKVR